MSQMNNPSDSGKRSEMSEMGNTSEMDDEPRQLDGNAAAGMLSELFTYDMTGAQTTCAHCGRTGAMGSLMLYGGQVGMVLRCPTCDAVQMRIVRVPERRGQSEQYWMDMRGMASLQIAPATSV